MSESDVLPSGQARSLTLADGRRLAYAEQGAPDGKPVVLLHGTPGGRAQLQIVDAAARAHGVRIVAPDRPGCGESEPAPGLSFMSYADDLRQLLDALKIEQTVIAGISGGGGFALAFAAAYPHRVSRVALVSALVPNPTAWRSRLPLPNRLTFLLAARWPALAERLMRASMNIAPDSRMARQAIAHMPEADRRIVSRAEIRELFFGAAMRDSLRQGPRAAVHELALYTRPAGFDVAAIRVPVSLLHGDADRNVPLCVAEHLATELPDAELQVFPGEGHLFIVESPERLLALI